MKFLIPTILLLLLCQNLNGQTDKDFKKIIEDCIRAKQDTGIIVYHDTALIFNPVIKRVLKKRVVSGVINDTIGSNIVLSKSERKIIIRESQSREKTVWPDSLFNLARKTSEGYSIYQSRRDYKIKVFDFSKPIFIRGNSVCVFQLIFMYGHSAGYNLLYFYKKENEIWRQWLMIVLGAW